MKSNNELKPIKFPEANYSLTKPENMSDDECGTLWVWSNGKQCISCWNLSFWQRIVALVSGKIWLSVLSGNTQPPVWIICKKTIFEKNKI